MAKNKTQFSCTECDHTEPKWMGRCPECGSWNTLVEEVPVSAGKASAAEKKGPVRSQALSAVEVKEESRLKSGLAEADRVLGGGMTAGSAILIGGEPGIGKSTLMMQIAAAYQGKGKVLYISGEESARQLKLRAERLGIQGGAVELFCETSLEKSVTLFSRMKPALVIIDSIQTMVSSEAGSIPGTVNQIKFCAYEMISRCKELEVPLFLTAHVTKEGQIAGPKVLEHLVDTVLYFEHGEGDLRILRAAKNRFGASDETGFFLMKAQGLQEVTDPAALFVTRREGVVPDGIAPASVYEGSRSFPVEIQTLVTPAKGSFSRTFSDKVDSQRVSRLAAVLEKMMKLRFSDQDLYVNVAGGIRLQDQGADLALAGALYSARTGIAIPADTILCGEVSLAGEVRPIAHLERRVKAAESAGYKRMILPAGKFSIPKSSMALIQAGKIGEAMKKAVSRQG